MDWSIWTEQDLNQYFTGTFIGVETEGEVIPHYVEGIAYMPDVKGLGFIGRFANKSIALPFASERVKVIIPESKFVNCDYEAYYLTRVTERQYKKGVRDRQFKVTRISEEERHDLLCKPRFNDQIVKGLFNSKVYSFEEALDLILKGERLSCAFHKHFCLAVKMRVENIVLYYKGNICGMVKDGNIELNENFMALQEKLFEIMEG